MKFDLITAEIGSTTTIVTAFDGIGTKKCRMAAQAEHFTTVNEGDVTIGIEKCLDDIKKKIGSDVEWEEFVATSSAAGGLRMSVHGLVYDMTVRAAKEGALGAGGLIRHVTSGKIDDHEVKKVISINPNMVLLAGGVDYGEKETILHNAKRFAEYDLNVPFVVAGNCAVREQVCDILLESGKRVYPTENVYPKVDQLNVDPIRDVIQTIFSEHIIHASGMDKIESIVRRPIIPTPAAVMNTTNLLYDMLGDVLTIDIGGATTDIDSVTRGSQDIQEITVSPEPFSKRTVEGDLGVFVNAPNVVESLKNELELELEYPDYKEIMKEITPYPKTEKMEQFMARLAVQCISKGLRRHAGQIRYVYGPSGRQKMAEGKDLTSVQAVVGTGGILTRSPYAGEVLSVSKILSKRHVNELLPPDDVKLYRDKNYIFAPIGAISRFDKDTAIELLKMDVERL